MIKSVLIANRGEIACRIIKTAKKMGIRTIAVYSDADSDALHTKLADEAHYIGHAPANESYLRNGRILSVAKEAQADAIHPGYGFLSENADFAQLAADAGMIFIGPPPSAIRSMGLKDKAKEIMAEAEVPVVPGYHGTNQTPDFLKRKAYEIGYPMLIKAVAGGGGKGMRKVEKALHFDDALEAAKREADAAFGNDQVLLEKFVENPRHIEIQVFADSHGNAVHLFERDCSLQRRHQKVIEEAPAPGMTEEMRSAMGKAACDAARAVGYEGAGTVEFIVDSADGLSTDGFFFMEMNTRLQVEHPVTEMISGVDLVEWQFRAAQGEALPKAQDEILLQGHAVEARIYAEDPDAGFLPSTGKLVAMDLGVESEQVRVDTGVETGDTISPYYDPMIAKLIVHAPTRELALETLELRLKSACIAGPTTNIAFLAKLSAHKSFRDGKFDTGLIDDNIDTLVSSGTTDDAAIALGVAGLISRQQKQIGARAPTQLQSSQQSPSQSPSQSPWQATDGFQLTGERELDWDYVLGGKIQKSRVRFDTTGISIQTPEGKWVEPTQNAAVFEDGAQIYLLQNGRQTIFEPFDYELVEGDAAVGKDGVVLVPMHGKIISVTVSDGDQVEQGDILFSVEAMKMEHAVISPADGIVSNLSIESGAQVDSGHAALSVKAADAE